MSAPHPPRHIETERLSLRPVAVGDAACIFKNYASSSKATRYMNWPRHRTEAESMRWAERCARCWEDGSAYPWAVLSRSGGEAIGNIELRINPPRADFGYIFAEQFWGHGFATEAATAIVNWSLTQPDIFRIWATCHPDNAASARVLSKAGLTLEARLANWEARPQLGELAGPSLMFAKTKPSVTPSDGAAT